MEKNIYNLTVGSDPEIFIQNETEIVSAEGLTGGNKWAPKPISDDGHAIQEDGIMFEYNIPPCKTSEEWVKNHKFCQDYLSVLASAHGFKFSTVVSSEINPQYLQSMQAKTFGCDPDYNVYLRCVNEAPNNETNLRCAGGHVSLGYNEPNQNTTEKLVKAFDIFLTLPSMLIDKDTRRRELYGKAGSFRFTDYGVEFRSLSNFWIHSEEHMKWVFDKTIEMANLVLEDKVDELIENYSDYVREAIDTNNIELAKELLTKIENTKKELITK